MPVEEHKLTLDGSPLFYRGAPSAPITPVYLHTAPTSSDDWVELLERTGGVAPDLIGFGRSGKGGHLDYSPAAMARVVDRVLEHVGAGQLFLAGHGWGAAVASALAAQAPWRVERLLLIDPAPPLAPARWHTLGRLWRTPVLGELTMGSINRFLLARALRQASALPGAWPADRVGAVWEHFDQGTQRATMRLYRWATPEAVEALAGELRTLAIPSLVMSGARDPWFPTEVARAWAEAIPAAGLEVIDQAGHWPWLERPETIGRIADFMAAR